MKIENVETAIKSLKSQGWKVERKGQKFLVFQNGAYLHDTQEKDYKNGREIVSFARAVAKSQIANDTIKELTAKPFRRKTRQSIVKEDWDGISNVNTFRGSKNNPWNFD